MAHWTYSEPRLNRKPPGFCEPRCPMWDGGRCVAAGLDVEHMQRCPEAVPAAPEGKASRSKQHEEAVCR